MSHTRHMGVHEAKTNFSRVLREVEQGEEIVIMRGSRPVARMISETPARSVADSYGMFEGQFQIGEDFDADNELLADLFGVADEEAAGQPARARASSRRR